MDDGWMRWDDGNGMTGGPNRAERKQTETTAFPHARKTNRQNRQTNAVRTQLNKLTYLRQYPLIIQPNQIFLLLVIGCTFFLLFIFLFSIFFPFCLSSVTGGLSYYRVGFPTFQGSSRGMDLMGDDIPKVRRLGREVVDGGIG